MPFRLSPGTLNNMGARAKRSQLAAFSHPSTGGEPESRGNDATSVAAAACLVQDLIQQLSLGNSGLEALLDALPEAKQDEWWGEGPDQEGKHPPQAERSLAEFLSEAAMDACASRVLVLGPPPRESRLLSSLSVGPAVAVQRVLVVGHSGEEVVLCWQMGLEDSLEPSYKGLCMSERWAVQRVTGEPACEELPRAPDPSVPPEAVVRSQLVALQALDLRWCYSFASPANRAAFRDDLSLFGSMLRSPHYSVLLGHEAAEVLNARQVSPSKFMCVCGVHGRGEGGETQRAVFVWVCGLRGEDDELQHCWLTDAVYRADTAAPVSPSDL